MTNLNPADLQKMTAHEVANLADLDFHSVRDEGFRRANLAEKKIIRLRKQLAQAEAEMAEAGMIIKTAFETPHHGA